MDKAYTSSKMAVALATILCHIMTMHTISFTSDASDWAVGAALKQNVNGVTMATTCVFQQAVLTTTVKIHHF